MKDKKKIDSKSILKDIESLKNDQLFKFLSEPAAKPTPVEEKFDDDFVQQDKVLKPGFLRQKVAPQTCAINKNELAHIVKYDLTDKLHQFFGQLDESLSDQQESQELLQELKELSNELERQKLEPEAAEASSEAPSAPDEPEKSVSKPVTPLPETL